eukprot:gnl/MRDRNA2_/MRDRNA2_449144_c0_seq1.p1 gnl/MRDRNA2_/MRDRNA2_449144_c0~~gnl/MRDRNA2_/MRDRNA2_449144_c0_seq1.p1  ORF type:complete len:111 (+),score=23.94 gnl/MRDRNA2_/MRDRNA2_449144_c0_seq1:208-540(+)
MHSDAKLFLALAQAAEQHVCDLSMSWLCDTVWSFAKAGHHRKDLFMLFAKAASQMPQIMEGKVLSPWHLANLAWGFAKAQYVDRQLFEVFARTAEQRVNEFTPRGLASAA